MAATTPCPHCAAEVPLSEGDEGSCPSCGARLRFVEVPDRPCDACGEAVPLPPDAWAVTCPACGLLQAAEAGRGVLVEVRCPRCRRRLRLSPDVWEAVCGHCGTTMDVKQGGNWPN